MNRPKVSIIIPCFNRADLIPASLDSCIKQTYSNLEIIVIDDGSKDHSVKICRDIEKSDSRVKVYESVNQGVSASRNIGLAISTGDFVYFLDSDDILMPYAIDYSLRCAKDHNVNIVVCGEGAFSNDGIAEYNIAKDLESAREFALSVNEQDPKQAILYENLNIFDKAHPCSFNTTLIKKSLVLKAGGFDNVMRAGEESLLKFRIGVLLPNEKVAWNFRPMTLLKRISNDSLATQVRYQTYNPWGIRSGIYRGDFILKQQLQKNYKYFFDDLYIKASSAFAQRHPEDALRAYAVWSQSGFKKPVMRPIFKHCLHCVFGFLIAETICEVLRGLKNPRRSTNR